jgi:predicted dithiol-disulfide oxidoreductase (DUF899 family)
MAKLLRRAYRASGVVRVRYTNLEGETDAHAAAREELRLAELDLADHRERVAALRRSLPPGPRVDDYALLEGDRPLRAGPDDGHPVRLSELVSEAGRPLIVYHLMFGKQQSTPCPMCTMWVDGFNGVARHVAQNADLAVVAAADLGELRAHGRRRGWDDLRLLSAGESTFKLDLGSEDPEGNQFSMVSVFTRDADGSMRHSYSATPSLSEERSERGIDLLCATWSLLDLTPHGRGDWYASLSY